MGNIMIIDGHKAVIQYDPQAGLFRGEFINLNGGADFYADSVNALRVEGARSLKVFLEVCAEEGIDPIKKYSGKFQLRLPESLHAQISEAAAALGVSINQFVQRSLEHELEKVGS